MNRGKESFFVFVLFAGICLTVLLGAAGSRMLFTEKYMELLGEVAERDPETAEKILSRSMEEEAGRSCIRRGEEVLGRAGYGSTGKRLLDGYYRSFRVTEMWLLVAVLSGIQTFFIFRFFSRTESRICQAKEQRIRADTKAEALERQCRILEKEMEEFMGNLYHQLKTPVAGLKLCLELMNTEYTDPAFECHRERGLLQTERLSSLITVLLKEGQLHANKIRFRYQPVILNDLLLDVTESMALFAAEKQMELICLPWEGENLISCDETWLKEAFQALIQNCVEHGDTGSHICIRTDRAPSGYLVDVCTEGKPLTEEEAAHLFERWYSFGASEGHFGIGMHLVKTVIQRHFGTVQTVSETEYPLVFHITLPALYGKEIYTVT